MGQAMHILDQINRHFGAIFLVWISTLWAVAIIADRTKRPWLRAACIVIGLASLAPAIAYLTALTLRLLVVLFSRR
jgi:hypothetical protein